MSGTFELGGFRLDAGSGVLTRDGKATALGTRAVAVLATLVEHANDYVSKAQLLDAAWPDTVVEEGNLPVQIASIRRELAKAGCADWIETLPRRGYRFVGPVKVLTIHRPDASAFPRSNLPAALTSFVGRERELVDIKRLLASKRLITILGSGGIGKTRLAVQVASEVVDAYRDGVWMAELGSMKDPALVPTAVAQTVGLMERTGKSATESILTYLKTRQVLLVLDNCEHLLDACARLAEAILRDAKEVNIIATSREPLTLAGEQSYPLRSLSLPNSESHDEICRSEAAQLFVERVQQHLPAFELTPERAPAVAGICIHLDGIPLALELAAARTRSLSVDQINIRLSDRFRLLTGGSRTALPRQQTLRATLDWSYDLLAEDERVTLRRLSVFPGSFTVEAASAITSDDRIDEYAVVDVLAQLVSRSLVIADTTTNGMRYRLLETTRAYALEKLAEAGETDASRRRHAEYFRDFLERAPDEWLRRPDAGWHATYLPELVNVRAALDWALSDAGDAAIAVDLAGSSGVLWSTSGLFGEGTRRLEAAIARVNPVTPERVQARLWNWLGRLVDETPRQARPALERAVRLYRRLDDPVGLGMSLARLARVLAHMGEFEQSEELLTEARPLLEASRMPRAAGFFFFNFAYLKSLSGDPLAARTYYERNLALDQEAGDEFATLVTMNNLGNVTWALGDLEASEATFREQLKLMRESPTRTHRSLGWVLSSLAGVLTERGQLDEAFALAREGVPLVAEDGSSWMFSDAMALLVGLAGRISDAAQLAGYADQMFNVKAAMRHPIDVRHRERLRALLRDKLAVDEFDRLLVEGAQLSEDEACRLALEGRAE